jgi:two-component system, chemotaxis family, sensor kinase CheA
MTLEMAKYLGLFVSEAGDHLAKLGAELVHLEAAREDGAQVASLVDGLFRHVHSLKGMAASMELEGTAALAHRAEDLVEPFRRRGQAPDPESVDVLLAAIDGLGALVQRAAGGESGEADPALLARVTAAAERARRDEPAGRGEAPPAATPLHRAVEVEVEVSPSCPVPSVRAFLVVKKLCRLGELVRATPGLEDLKAGRLPERRLALVLATAEPLAEVERALAQISDLAAVKVREVLSPAPLPAPIAAPVRSPAADPPRPAEAVRTVRVRVDLLDSFLDAVGELILATSRLREIGRALPEAHRPPLEDGVDRLHATVKDLHDKVMAVRMTPLAAITDRLPRTARDLARRVGKQVEVEVHGTEIEIDRAVLDELGDPLMHLVRNAVDHGLEGPAERLAAGKAATGHLTLSARRERDRVLIEIADDGRGMDPERLRRAAVERGALTASAARALGDREALLLACLPGVSTAPEVTELSGRGVGLDAVKKSVEALGGALEIDSARGRGTRFVLRLPLTVAVQQVLLVRVAGEVLALPIAKVHGAAQVDLADLDASQGAPVLPYDGALVPVRDLGALLGFGGARPAPCSVVVADGDGGPVGLAVDALLGQQEAVLKPLQRPFDLVGGLSAVTVLASGRPVFVLDVLRLVTA